MSLLDWEEVTNFSLFKCKLCNGRLQSPVMQVEGLGNACGGCSKNYTNITNNLEIETILSKYFIPCNFKNVGCNFVGLFTKTCKHEQDCAYRDLKCPICDNNCAGIHAFGEHFHEKHAENILNIENGRVSVPTSDKKQHSFYLLIIEGMPVLIECNRTCQIRLAFYYYKSDPWLRVNFNLDKKRKRFNVMSHDIYPINMNERSHSNQSNIFKLNRETLGYLAHAGYLTIGVDVRHINKTDGWKFLDYFKCSVCSQYDGNIYGCSCKRYCEKCKGDGPCQSCGNCIVVTFKTNTKLLCNNNGCDNTSSTDQFSCHNKTFSCSVHQCASLTKGNCLWKGVYSELLGHLWTEHANIVNQKWQVSEKIERRTRIFIQYNYIICCICCLENKRLSFGIKIIGPESFRELLVWELCAQTDNKTLKLSGGCSDIDNKLTTYSLGWDTLSTGVNLSLNIKPKVIE